MSPSTWGPASPFSMWEGSARSGATISSCFSQYGLRSEYYHPFTPPTHWFVAPRAFINDDPLYIYQENKLISIYRRDEGGGAVDVGYQFGTTGELRVGYEGGWQKFGLQIGNPNELTSFSGAYGATQRAIQAGSPGQRGHSAGRTSS